MGILGLTDEQVEKAAHQTQADIDAANRVNYLHLYETELAILRRYRELKILALQTEIASMIQAELTRRIVSAC